MDYKGKKVWFFRVIPLVYSSDGSEWAVDINQPTLNELADRLVVAALRFCATLHIPVMLSDRASKPAVKNQPTGNRLPGQKLTGV